MEEKISMTKRKIYMAAVLAVLLVAVFVLTSCGASSFTVTYMNGGTTYQTQQFASNAKIAGYEINPTREGYEFAGWFYDTDFEDAIDPETDKVTSNITLYAKFISDEEYNEIKGFDVTFVTNGGETIPVTKYAKIKSQPISKKHSSRLEGWYTDATLSDSSKITYPYVVTQPITLYAKWSDYSGILYTLQSNNQAYSVVAYSGDETDIVIAGTYEQKPVTRIEKHAFKDLTGIRSVTIPSSILEIRDGAFSGCTNLEKVNSENIGEFKITSSVTRMGTGIFDGCGKVTSLTLPFIGADTETNASYDAVLGYVFGYEATDSAEKVGNKTYQFYDSKGKKYYHYAIPSTLTAVNIIGGTVIPAKAFYNCENLTSVTIGGDVTEIRMSAFYNCKNLTTLSLVVNVPPACSASVFQSVNPALVISVPAGAKNTYLENEFYKDYIK